ncbi:MAG: MurT ligase domain-containing protein [Thermomicrobiales bacterium]
MPIPSSRFDPRLASAVAASRLSRQVIQRLGRGGGTSAPGVIAQRLDPGILRKLSARMANGTIVVAGTNGKTTTSRMIANILESDNQTVIHNRSGSNLVRGAISALADHSTWAGQPRGQIAVIETDEAALPDVVRDTQPRMILLNNLFRDQLDRYGELDTVARKWRGALELLDERTTLIVNADDPSLMSITDNLRVHRVTFGLHGQDHHLAALPHAADSSTCRSCGAELGYHALYVSHLGDWYCNGCGRRRPDLDATGTDIVLHGMDSLAMTVHRIDEALKIDLGVPGLYNAYNALAAVAACRELDVSASVVAESLAEFRAAFGRLERVEYKGRLLTLILVKNPVGFNEVLRMLTAETGSLVAPTLIAINDLDADGRDVSWLWDVDFELLAEGSAAISTTGIRGTDMANRLKYAGVPGARLESLPSEMNRALDTWIDSIPVGEKAIILPTYTAMLDVRRLLTDTGATDAFWKQ